MVMGSLREETQVVVIGSGPGGYIAALRLADLALRQIEGNADVIELALDASGLERIVAAGRIAAVLLIVPARAPSR